MYKIAIGVCMGQNVSPWALNFVLLSSGDVCTCGPLVAVLALAVLLWVLCLELKFKIYSYFLITLRHITYMYVHLVLSHSTHSGLHTCIYSLISMAIQKKDRNFSSLILRYINYLFNFANCTLVLRENICPSVLGLRQELRTC
jgi:hypothetical protein